MKEIFDIFSTRKPKIKKEQKKCKVIIDYREKNCLVVSELEKLGLDTEFKELKVADYIIKDVAIERKTVSDFISSMINKRLSNQIEELKQYKNKLLIIEGIDEQELYPEPKYAISSEAFGNRRSEFRGKSKKTSGLSSNGVNPNAIRGFLLSILLKHKIPIMFTQNYKDTAKFILTIAKKRQNETSLNAKKKSLNSKEQMQFILEGFPGIGPKNAKKLLKKFSTLQNIFSAPQDELQKIIGKKAEVFLLLEKNY